MPATLLPPGQSRAKITLNAPLALAPFLPFLASAAPRRTSWQMPQARRPSYEPCAGIWGSEGSKWEPNNSAEWSGCAGSFDCDIAATSDHCSYKGTHLVEAGVGQVLGQLHVALGVLQLVKDIGTHKQEVALAVWKKGKQNRPMLKPVCEDDSSWSNTSGPTKRKSPSLQSHRGWSRQI